MFFTVRADLLPQTEQVQFIKAGPFGVPQKFLVDLKDLKKMEISEIYEDINFAIKYKHFDNHLAWKDERSGEIFLMDQAGFWSKSGIEHPLINK